MKVKQGLEKEFRIWLAEGSQGDPMVMDAMRRRDAARLVIALGGLLDQDLPFQEIDDQIQSPHYAAYEERILSLIRKFHPRGEAFTVWKSRGKTRAAR